MWFKDQQLITQFLVHINSCLRKKFNGGVFTLNNIVWVDWGLKQYIFNLILNF